MEKNFKFSIAALLIIAGPLFLLAGAPASWAVYESGSLLDSGPIQKDELPDRKGLEIDDNLIWHAGISNEVIFDGNIFLGADGGDSKQDTIELLSPYTGVEMLMGENSISFEYEPVFKFYHRFPEQSSVDHYLRGMLDVHTNYHDILVEDNYKRFTNTAGTTELGSAGRRTREERNDFDYSIAAEYDQLDYRFTYSNRIRNFLGKNQELFENMNYDDRDNMYNEVNMEAGYKFWPNTAAVVQTVFGHVYHRSGLVPSSVYQDVLFGLKGEIVPRDVLYDIRVGVRWQDYFKSGLVRNKPYADVVARAEIEYRWSDDDFFRAYFLREDPESIYADMSYFNSNYLAVEYNHFWGDRISTKTYFNWQYAHYPYDSVEDGVTDKRWDTTTAGGVTLRVDMNKWVSLEAGYEYSVRNSRFGTFDYQDNKGTIRVTAGY